MLLSAFKPRGRRQCAVQVNPGTAQGERRGAVHEQVIRDAVNVRRGPRCREVQCSAETEPCRGNPGGVSGEAV